MPESAWTKYISTDATPATLSALSFRQPQVFEDVANDASKYIAVSTEFLPPTGDEARNLTLGCVIRPFCPSKPGSEFEVPVVDKSSQKDLIARCKSCQAFLNKYCSRDRTTAYLTSETTWSCVICRSLNTFPSHYFQKSSNSFDNNKNAYELTRPVVEYFVNNTYFGIADNKREMLTIVLERNRLFAQSKIRQSQT